MSDNIQKNTPKRPGPVFNITYMLIGLVVFWLIQDFVIGPMVRQATEIPYSAFRQKLTSGQIVSAQIDDTSISGLMKNPNTQTQPA